jgi:tRNA_anti-like
MGWCALSATAFLLTIGCGGGKPAEQNSTQTIRTLSVSALDLWTAYERNQRDADMKFKGTVLQVSGTVRSVSSDASKMRPHVMFDTGARPGVQADLADDYRLPSGIVKGSALTLKCRGDGKFGNVILRDCVQP